MDYTTLIADKGTLGSIKAWANYDKLPSEDILEAAQATIYTVLRVRETQEFFTGTITTSTLALPDNFREPIRIRHLNSNPGTISIQPANRFDERLVYTGGVLPVGEPTECTFDAENVYFNKTPAAPLPFKMWYTAKVEDLSPSNPRNFLTDRYPNILRAACMYWASGFDKRIDRDH